MVALVLATFLVFPSRYEELRQAHMGDVRVGTRRGPPEAWEKVPVGIR